MKRRFIKYLLLTVILLFPLSLIAADSKISDMTALGERPARTDEFTLHDASTGDTVKVDFSYVADIPNADDYGGLTAAVAAIGSTATTLLIDTAQTVSADLSVPSTMSLIILRGGSVAISATKTLTMNGTMIAGAYRVFTGSGAVSWGANVLIHDSWEDGSGDDVLPSADNAIDLGGPTLEFKDLYIDGTAYIDALGNSVAITAASAGTSDLYMIADAAEDNPDSWNLKATDAGNGNAFQLLNKTSGSYVAKFSLDPDGGLTVFSFTAPGADPMCWDGSGESEIGDCSSTIEVKERIATYALPGDSHKVKALKQDEKDRIDGHFPGDPKAYTSNLGMLKDIEVYTFNLTSQPEQALEDEIGILAEQVYKVNPLLVNIRTNKDGVNEVKGIAWFNTIAWLIKVNQEQQAQIEDLQSRVTALEAK